MREVSSRKADRPVVDLSSGGKAPIRRVRAAPVPKAEGILDGIGTGDTGATALQRAAGESRIRVTRICQIGPDTDPQVWLDRYGQVDDYIDFAWKCERPVRMGLWQRPHLHGLSFDPLVGAYARFHDGGEWHMKVPCRKCWPCQLQRKREWVARAINEARIAKRTWFFTGTFRDRPEGEWSVVKEYQDYLKRLRKKHALRYLAVLEQGERNGRLHVHMLLHGDVKYRDLQQPWTAGFMQAKLVKAQFDEHGQMDADSARQIMYVAGYVTGDIAFRIRNSLRYGRVAPPDQVRRAGTPCCQSSPEGEVTTSPSGTERGATSLPTQGEPTQ